jgi:hypothetical protein
MYCQLKFPGRWSLHDMEFYWMHEKLYCPFFFWMESNGVCYYWVHYWLSIPAPDDDGWRWEWSNLWSAWQGKPKYSEKTCPKTALSTTNPTRHDLDSNSGRRGGKPATNSFSYGMAQKCTFILAFTFIYFSFSESSGLLPVPSCLAAR